MAKARVSVEDVVEILSTRVDRRRNELRVRISRPWDELNPALIDGLFAEARRIGNEKHPTLKEGWTLNFFYKK